MSAFLSRRRLLVVAVPIGLLAAALAGLLPAGSKVASNEQTAARDCQAGFAQICSPSASPQLAQAITESPNIGDTGGTAGPISSASKPVLKVYGCSPGNAQAVAAWLQREFGGDPSVRVVPDGRTSQVLVMAPPEIQAKIAVRLGTDEPEAGGRQQAAGSGQPAAGGGQPAAATAGLASSPLAPRPLTPEAAQEATSSQEVQLWHTTGEQFEAALVRMLGDRLTPIASSQPGASAYRLTLAGERSLKVSIRRDLNRVDVEGAGAALASCVQLIHLLDSPEQPGGRTMRLVSLKDARSADIQRVIDAIRNVGTRQASGAGDASTLRRHDDLRLAMVYQQPEQTAPDSAEAPAAEAAPATPAPAGQEPAPPDAAVGAEPEGLEGSGGLIGPVQVEILPGTDILVIRGHERDVQKVVELIEQIEQISKEEKPLIRVYHLLHVDSRSLATLLNQLYEDIYSARQGSVSITALVKPNAVLLIGRQESVDTVVDLIKRLDRPVPPSTQFRVFRLKNTAAETAQETIEEFFADRYQDEEEGGLATRVQVAADFRTNSLLVWASPRDLAEVAAIIARMDAPENETVNEVRIFKLKNSLAEDLAPVLQDAITGQMYGQRTGQRAIIQRIAGTGEQFERKSIRLQFVPTDPEGGDLLNSGVLTDVQVTADARANALIVTASADSMPLIAALIRELDSLPTAEAQVKVFTVVNGDASNLVQTLQNLFSTQAQAGAVATRTGASGEDSSLVTLRFAVDVRSNSIIATGSSGDLDVVEAILLRLDESDLRARQTVVIRLKNASAQTVADAVSEFLTNELDAEQPVQGLLSSVERTEREVVVVPEAVTNSLIVSATERFYERIVDLVDKLDARPPMVLIQVLIAAVTLNDTDEFGVEVGLQDSILFDRSVSGMPGFLFNSTGALGNNTSAGNPRIVGSQGISNLALGRSNPTLGYGGLVLSASSEAVSVLVRALKDQRRLDILGRPQIMTVDNVMATIHVGENVPYITQVNPATNLASQTFSVDFTDVGIQLQVTPRINPDGLVVMNVTAIRSQLGPESEGIPISVAADGTVIRSPRIEIAETNSTVSAMNGQTVVLGGLITKDTSQITHRVPWLSDVPVLGRLFRFDGTTVEKTELLFILTPHVVESEEEAERVKRIEAARIDWCLNDVLEIHGDPFAFSQGTTPVIYPDIQGNIQNTEPTDQMPELPELPDGEEGQSPFMMEPVTPGPGRQPAPPGQPPQGSAMRPIGAGSPVR